MTNQQAPEIYALHTVPNKGERPWSGIYAVRADAEHDAKVLRDATGRDWSVVRLVVADTATTPTGPVARYKIGYHTDDWGVRSSSPSGIPDPAGAWVRYEDHIAALVDAQQPAPSAAAAGNALPEGWVPLVITHEGQYPEEVAYGPQILMDRLGKWLRKYFDHVVASKAQPSPTAQADSRSTPVEELDDDACRCEPSDYVRPADYDGDGSVAAMARRAARAPAESVLAPAGGGAVVEWHAPGLGEVHNESHGQLIFCTDGDDVADDTLARRVCAALNATPPAQAAESVQEDAARLEALHAAVTAIYLDDSSDFKSALGAVVRHLDPKLAGDLLALPKRAFAISKARLDAARKQGATP